MPCLGYDIYIYIYKSTDPFHLWVDFSAPSFIWIETVRKHLTKQVVIFLPNKKRIIFQPTIYQVNFALSGLDWSSDFPQNIHWFAFDVLRVLRIFKAKVIHILLAEIRLSKNPTNKGMCLKKPTTPSSIRPIQQGRYNGNFRTESKPKSINSPPEKIGWWDGCKMIQLSFWHAQGF